MAMVQLEVVRLAARAGFLASGLPIRNVSRLVKPSAGRILFEGADLGHSEPHDVVARSIVQVPEGRRIFLEPTVLENLRMGSYLPGALKDREKSTERVFSLFPRLKSGRSSWAEP
jgi:branched-chain amino acid transport system ATP-binding protein